MTTEVSSVRSVKCQATGRTMKLGRNRSSDEFQARALRLGNYLAGPMIQPPKVVDYATKAAAALKQIYMNNQLGCCVFSGYLHIKGVLQANGISPGKPRIYTDAEVVKLYSAAAGYVPGRPSTDNGANEGEALDFFVKNGDLAGDTKPIGYLSLDATNPNEIMGAMWRFGNLFFGIELPDAWLNPMPQSSGFTWGRAGRPDPGNGHCIIGAGHDLTKGVNVCTWGMMGFVTWDAIAEYCVQNAGGELYVMIDADILDAVTKRCPAGLDWGSLIRDFDAMGGQVPPAPITPIDWMV